MPDLLATAPEAFDLSTWMEGDKENIYIPSERNDIEGYTHRYLKVSQSNSRRGMSRFERLYTCLPDDTALAFQDETGIRIFTAIADSGLCRGRPLILGSVLISSRAKVVFICALYHIQSESWAFYLIVNKEWVMLHYSFAILLIAYVVTLLV